MYDDDYDNKRDSRRLSDTTSPPSESISTSLPAMGGSESPSPQQTHEPPHETSNDEQNHRKTNGQDKRSSIVGSNSPSDAATTSFPLNDIDYESNPDAVAQELSNLAAIRRMSMDVTATGDPDLPSFGSNWTIPSIAPSPSADPNDTSRLFWVPARLHPELAPKEFKSFLESKAEQIRRMSREFSAGSGSEGSGGGLRRKKSMLSRQIDDSSGYTDGAERLERKRTQSQRSKQDFLTPNLHDLVSLVDDSKQNKDAVSLLQGLQNLDLSGNEDKPILPPAPPGHSLRRSTRTQYRKGSLKNGQRLPYSKRFARTSESTDGSAATATTSDDAPPVVGLSRTLTDPTPSSSRTQNYSKLARSTALPPGSTPGSSSESTLEQTDSENRENRASAPPQTRQWHSRISSNGRSTLQIPPSAQRVPQIPEAPSQDENQAVAGSSLQQNYIPERTSSHDSPQTSPPQGPLPKEPTSGRGSRRPSLARSSVKESVQTLDDVAANPAPLPGHVQRTDSLSIIPTLTEDKKSTEEKKSESKKSKDKKETDGFRKSSWHWLRGNEDKEKEKDKKKDKEGDSKKTKSKSIDNTRLDVLQTSIDGGQRGRESLVLDRSDVKSEEERRKESARKSSGESKKEKDSRIFSSIFGREKKKSGGEGHKKSSSRNYSPDPPVRELRPDIDYNWSRFSILEERAIYRMAHIKLANPKRALYSQVLLSNFMYSYLAKVQQMHPHMMLPTSPAQRQQQLKASNQQDTYSQYQTYPEVSS